MYTQGVVHIWYRWVLLIHCRIVFMSLTQSPDCPSITYILNLRAICYLRKNSSSWTHALDFRFRMYFIKLREFGTLMTYLWNTFGVWCHMGAQFDIHDVRTPLFGQIKPPGNATTGPTFLTWKMIAHGRSLKSFRPRQERPPYRAISKCINNDPVYVNMVAWCRTCALSLSEPILAQFTGAHACLDHDGSLAKIFVLRNISPIIWNFNQQRKKRISLPLHSAALQLWFLWPWGMYY